MEKDVRDFVEECEPQLIITLPQAGQLNERMSVEPSGRPMNPQASYSGDQGKGNAAIAQMSLRLADGIPPDAPEIVIIFPKFKRWNTFFTTTISSLNVDFAV